MDRKRTLLAAGGISVLLVASSSAFAFANGIFVTRPVDRVGSFQAIQARLATETKPASTPTTERELLTTTSAPIPASTAAVTATTRHAVAPTTTLEIDSTSEPSIVTTTTRSVEHPDAPDIEPATTATTATSARRGPSTVPPTHDDDADEPPDGRGSDD